MRIKGRQYLEKDVGGGLVRLSMKGDGYHVDVDRKRLEAWVAGDGYIQDARPELSAEQREFLLSGADPEQFKALFGEDEP